MNQESAFAGILRREFFPIRALSDSQVHRLYEHYELLVRWNKVLNLTSIRGLEDTVIRHYCESLFAGSRLPENPGAILDFGAGAGFPGFPIAVLRPEVAVTLAESHQRKAVFLREAARRVSNIRIAAKRAEELEEPFAWVVSRAVGWEEVLPVVRAGVALLVGEEDARSVVHVAGFVWEPAIGLPWGKRRRLVIGRRECST